MSASKSKKKVVKPGALNNVSTITTDGIEGTAQHRRGGEPEQPDTDVNGTMDDGAIAWLTYTQAAAYTGYSIRYLRNLVSADAIPVYGSPRSRRFRRDVLDQFLTNRDAAMRKFRLERQAHHGD
jgi:excisionase family DNA binding protein